MKDELNVGKLNYEALNIRKLKDEELNVKTLKEEELLIYDSLAYEIANDAIKILNKSTVKEFSDFKAKVTPENLTKEAKTLYKRLDKKARQIFLEEYLIQFKRCGGKKPKEDWLEEYLFGVNDVTLYSYDSEVIRKRDRLTEALEVKITDKEIKKGRKYWVDMTNQYADNIAYDAMKSAYKELTDKVMWLTAEDERVCEVCNSRHKKIYNIDELPARHWRCRCTFLPVFDK